MTSWMIRGLKRGSCHFCQVFEFLLRKFQSSKASQLEAHSLCVQPTYSYDLRLGAVLPHKQHQVSTAMDNLRQ